MLSFSRVSNWCLVISGQKEVVVFFFLRDCESKLKDKCMKIKKNQKSIQKYFSGVNHVLSRMWQRNAYWKIQVPLVNFSESKTNLKKKKKKVTVIGCFTIPFQCFPFCHFSIILGISVRQALFLKLPLFHRFLYFMISACSSLVVQTEVAAWGNQAVAVTFKPQVVSGWDWHGM